MVGSRLEGSHKHSRALEQDDKRKLVELLDELAGEGKGAEVIRELIDAGKSPKRIAREIGRSPTFERLYKETRTLDKGQARRISSDPSYIGLEHWDTTLSFEERFRTLLKPILNERAEGFGVIFDALRDYGACPVIVETGCLRIPGNWAGDGQSTFMFDAFAQETSGSVISVDVAEESIATARRACGGSTQLIWNDSVAALNAIGSLVSKPVALLYLNSYDFDEADPLPSAIHHAIEFMAARRLIGARTIIAVDDYALGREGGKGMIVDRYLDGIGVKPLYQGYQKIWQLPS